MSEFFKVLGYKCEGFFIIRDFIYDNNIIIFLIMKGFRDFMTGHSELQSPKASGREDRKTSAVGPMVVQRGLPRHNHQQACSSGWSLFHKVLT